MGGASCFIKHKKYMKVSGKMIKRKVMEFKNSQIDAFTKETIHRASQKERAYSAGVMDKLTMDNGEKVKGTALVFGKEQMVKLMKGNGGTASQMELGLLQAMAIIMKDNLDKH